MKNKYMIHYTYTEVMRGSIAYSKSEKKDFTFFTEEDRYNVEDRCSELYRIFTDFCVVNICKL